jgi:hypothetical protein
VGTTGQGSNGVNDLRQLQVEQSEGTGDLMLTSRHISSDVQDLDMRTPSGGEAALSETVAALHCPGGGALAWFTSLTLEWAW